MFENFDPRWSDSHDRNGQDELDREIYRDSRERGDDPRDALLNDLDLPRGLERELVLDRDRVYELNGEDSRMLGAVGVFRVVPERDLGSRDDDALDCRNDSLEHLIDEGLVRTLSLDGHDRGVTLMDRGRDLIEANRRDRNDDRQQEFYAGVMADLSVTITCPSCGHAAVERMPTDRCVYFDDCTSCHAVLKPKPGDCCVYCSSGDKRCPFVRITTRVLTPRATEPMTPRRADRGDKGLAA